MAVDQKLDAEHAARADALRSAMVQELREQGAIRSEAVAAAVAAVPRHLFAPGEPLEAAYAAQGIVVAKRALDGRSLSVMSAANLQAAMLEQAEIEPGMTVLEVGSGGYNAALLQELVGPGGKVTTVDIDPDITARARTCLDTAGYGDVDVVLADAEAGVQANAPYDRIVVTAGAWDIPPAWISQLSPKGRLVVPLRLRGITRSVAFDREAAGLVSRSYSLARFVPVQGKGEFLERRVMLRDGVWLEIDAGDLRLNVRALAEALDAPPQVQWSGAVWDLPDELELFMTMNLPHSARLYATQHNIDQGLIGAAAAMGVTALVTDESLAYRTRRPDDSTGGFESGVIAHGPDARTLARQYADLLSTWARDHSYRGAATFRYLPTAAAPIPPPAGAVIKRHGVVTVSWR